MNIVDDAKIALHSPAAAAAQTTIEPDGVDCVGFCGVAFVVVLGEVVSGGAVTVHAEVSSDDGDADAYAAIAGSAITEDDGASGKTIVLDIQGPPERYVRCVVTRDTQDSEVSGIISILYGASKAPTATDASVATIKRLSQPIMGSAWDEVIVRPTVESTSPVNAATNFAVDGTITVTFSEEIDPLTISETTVYLVAGGGGASDVATTAVDLDAETGTIATLTLAGDLTGETVYKIRVETDVASLATGHRLAEQYTQATGFTTEDVTAPTVEGATPPDEATDVAVDATLTVQFDEPIDPATAIAANIKLVAAGGGAADVATSSVALDEGGTVATLTMASNLTAATVYKFRVTTSVTDLAGNALASQFTQANGFTTAGA